MPAGPLEVRLVVRHESAALLRTLSTMACVLEFKLDKPLKLEVAHSRSAALGDPELGGVALGGSGGNGGDGGGPLKPPLRLSLEAGSRCALHVLTPVQPEMAEAGDVLVGTITYAKAASAESQGSGRRPGGWPVSMVCIAQPLKELPNDGAPPAAAAGAAEADEHATGEDAFARGALELRLTQLSKLSAHAAKLAAKARGAGAAAGRAAAALPAEVAAGVPAEPRVGAAGGAGDAAAAAALAAALRRCEALFAALCADAADAPAPPAPSPQAQPPSLLLRALCQRVAHCDALAPHTDAGALRAVVDAAERALAHIDASRMASSLAAAADPDEAAQCAEKEAAEAHKKLLVSALTAKAQALADLAKAAPAGGADAALSALDGAMAALHRWAPPAEHAKLAAAWHSAHGRHALALGALDEALGKEKGAPAKADVQARLAPLRALGWAQLAAGLERELLVNYPSAYPPGFA